MTIYRYLDVDWSKVRLNKNNMNVKRRKNDEREWDDISVPDEMWVWLNGKCGTRFTSQIRESEWWWDREADDEDHVFFFFRDPVVSLQFKLTFS